MADYQTRREHKLAIEFTDLREWIVEKRGVTLPAYWPEVEILTNADGEGGVQITWTGPWQDGPGGGDGG